MAFDFPTGPGENYARRISLGDDFMNWAIDDLLYGYLFITLHMTKKERSNIIYKIISGEVSAQPL